VTGEGFGIRCYRRLMTCRVQLASPQLDAVSNSEHRRVNG
jgi:hypothetical protein